MSNKTKGFLNLSHINTLKKCSSFTSTSVGFNQELFPDNNIVYLEDYQKNVILNFDENKIKNGPIYRR